MTLNNSGAKIESICIYPIKSLDGVMVKLSQVTAGGALALDREFLIVGADGESVIGKTEPRIFQLRANFDLQSRTVKLCEQGQTNHESFDLNASPKALESYLSNFFGRAVYLKRNPEGGFPDSRRGSGPTIISRASLNTISSWFAGLGAISSDEVFRRLRTNIIVEHVEPFWEDRIVPKGDESTYVPFEIGNCPFEGVGPVKRCPVPARDPETGHLTRGFQRVLIQQREKSMPEWTPRAAFPDGFYYAASKTRGREGCVGRTIKVGDTISIR